MGNATLGNTAGGDSVQFYFNDPGTHEVAFRSGDTLTAPEEMYIDAIHCFCSGDGASAASSTAGIYSTSNILVAQTGTFTVGASVAYYTASFSAGSYYHVSSGAGFVGAVNIRGGTGGRTWGRNDGGAFRVQTGLSSLPTNFGGSVQSGLGNWPWYVTYFKACSISALSVSHGVQGSNVTLTGVSFTAGINSISFDGGAGVNATSWTVNSDTSLTVTVPAGAVSGTITVNTNAGSGTSGTYLVDPTISSISPTHGTPGTSVIITGTGFNSSTSVKFHTNVSATYTVNSDTQITATCPHGATTGGITVNGGGSSATSATFTVDSSITSFSPAAGGVGTTITLTGTGFTGSSAGKVNGTACTSYTVVSDTSVTMVVAVGSTTGFLTIVNSGGSTVTSATQFIVAAAYVFRSSVWTSGSVEVERSGVETQAQGVSVFRSGAWVSAQ